MSDKKLKLKKLRVPSSEFQTASDFTSPHPPLLPLSLLVILFSLTLLRATKTGVGSCGLVMIRVPLGGEWGVIRHFNSTLADILRTKICIEQGYSTIKETVSRDYQPLVLFIKQLTRGGSLDNDFDFLQIYMQFFKIEIDSEVYVCRPQRGVDQKESNQKNFKT